MKSLNKRKLSMPEIVEVVVRPYTDKSPRSNQQSRYYWGVVIPLISDYTGYTKDEIHEILKHLFLAEMLEIKSKDGEQHKIRIAKSTTDLNTTEMEDFLSNIRQWAAMELGVFVPTPNEADYGT